MKKLFRDEARSAKFSGLRDQLFKSPPFILSIKPGKDRLETLLVLYIYTYGKLIRAMGASDNLRPPPPLATSPLHRISILLVIHICTMMNCSAPTPLYEVHVYYNSFCTAHHPNTFISFQVRLTLFKGYNDNSYTSHMNTEPPTKDHPLPKTTFQHVQ